MEIDSISLASTVEISPSEPSIRTSGASNPRIFNVALSEPGRPEDCKVTNPGILPERAFDTVETGDFIKSSPLTEATEPAIFTLL